MCRILFTYKKVPPSHMSSVLQEFQMYYVRYCNTNKLSYGVVGFDETSVVERRGTRMPECDDHEFMIVPSKYAMYHIRFRNGPGPSTIANTHPIVTDRYVFMHNGRIQCLDAPGRTDSQVFFDRIIALHPSTTTLRDALKASLVGLTRPLLNVVIMDRYTGEFIAYHHPGNVPSLFWDALRGIVTNWQTPHSKEIKMLWRPAYNKKIQHDPK